MAVQDFLTKDIFGYDCVEEHDLDLVFLSADKGLEVPQTCMTLDTPKDFDVYAGMLGRTPTQEEWSIFTWRWLRLHFPDKKLLTPPEVDIASVPLPSSLGLMIGVISILALVAIWCKMNDLENIR